MNRRKAIFRITLAGAAVALATAGIRIKHLGRTPDLNYLSQSSALLSELAETIIPRTNTPGAKDAKVHEFIIMMIRDCTDTKTQNKFIDGLKDLVAYTKEQTSLSFMQCSEQQRTSILQYFEKHSSSNAGILGKIQTRFLGRPFFPVLKQYTVEGYCTSQAGASQALNYSAVPGSYNACIPLQSGQTAWATN